MAKVESLHWSNVEVILKDIILGIFEGIYRLLPEIKFSSLFPWMIFFMNNIKRDPVISSPQVPIRYSFM